jgi:hypothetical protein
MFSQKKRKAVGIFWMFFGVLMILAMVGFLLAPLVYTIGY